MSSVQKEGSSGSLPYTAVLDFTTSRRTGLSGPLHAAMRFMVPMTLVSCTVRAPACCGSTMSPECTTVSMPSPRMSLPTRLWRMSARTKSVRASWRMGPSVSTATICSTLGSASRRRASSAPQKRETPVMRMRLPWATFREPPYSAHRW